MGPVVQQDEKNDAAWRRFQRLFMFLLLAPMGLNIALTVFIDHLDNDVFSATKNWIFEQGIAWVPNAHYHLVYLTQHNAEFAYKFVFYYIVSHFVYAPALVLSVTAIFFILLSVRSQISIRVDILSYPFILSFLFLGIAAYFYLIVHGIMYLRSRYPVNQVQDVIFGVNFYFAMTYGVLFSSSQAVIVRILRTA